VTGPRIAGRLWRGAGRWLRQLLPRTVRVRLSLLYALLFLAAGAALLGLTYGLVASSLPGQQDTSKLTGLQNAQLLQACKRNPQQLTGNLLEKCKLAFAAGARTGAASQRDQTLQHLLLFSLIGLALMTVVSGGLGWVMAGRALRPVTMITGAARRASERHLGERLALRGPQDELKELADTFDEMLERLDVAFASQRRFVADASHELRTPLTVMRTAIDVTLAKPSRTPEQLETMAAKVRQCVDQAESLIEALLTLAASDGEQAGPDQADGQQARREPVDLATASEDALDAAGPAIRRLQLHIDTELEPATATGNRLLLERMTANLIDNAVRHNNPGGWVRIRTGTTNGATFLHVVNSGPIIPEGVVPSLFEPFRRVEERTSAQDGVGLGLAIVSSIGRAHGASVEARSIPGGGLEISVVLPRDTQT
jgi:signal transduction histidine kinase